MHRLPPFGKVLQAYADEKIQLDKQIYVFVGKASRKFAIAEKKCGGLCSYLEWNCDFEAYRWPVEDKKVVVIDTGGMEEIELKLFCLHLLRKHSARVIFLWSETYPNQLFLPEGISYDK